MKGLYIHIPFCVKKCAYCDFVSYCGREGEFDSYIDTLKKEMQKYSGEKLDSVFIGGGTPTVLDAVQIHRLMSDIKNNFELSPECEITSEANPGTVDDEKITAMLDSGINRISIGVQSFNDDELKIIGRIHDAEAAYKTVCRVHECGFKNINIDLMTALPFQTEKSLQNTVKTALSLPITHISAYSLIIEENTPLERMYSQGKIQLPTEDEDRGMYAKTVETLANAGFERYEISNFAKKGFECRHNIKYWSCDEYIGIGAAAHSYVGDKRFSNPVLLEDYISGKSGEITNLTNEDKISEFMIMGLRMAKGVEEAEFLKRFGVKIEDVFGNELEKFTKMGLILHQNGRYFLSDRGIDVSNSVMCEFV